MRSVLLLLPVIFTILTSGCTMPGDFCIPGFTCGQTVEETHDVIVIESLQALPDTLAPKTTTKIVAIVSNVAGINAEETDADVCVELYDYCAGLFKEPTTTVKSTSTDACSGSSITAPIGIKLLRGEKAQIEWDLEAEEVPVKTECNLKVRAKYQYTTKSITTLHLIDYIEMQRKINDGTFSEIGSYTSVGFGPIKPYIVVEGTQPIPVQDKKVSTVLSLQIINKGQGFLSTANSDTTGNTPTGPAIEFSTIKFNSIDTFSREVDGQMESCKSTFAQEHPDGLRLIRKESTKIPCTIEATIDSLPLEATKTLLSEVNEYWYEFRDQIKVTVEPRF